MIKNSYPSQSSVYAHFAVSLQLAAQLSISSLRLSHVVLEPMVAEIAITANVPLHTRFSFYTVIVFCGYYFTYFSILIVLFFYLLPLNYVKTLKISFWFKLIINGLFSNFLKNIL